MIRGSCTPCERQRGRSRVPDEKAFDLFETAPSSRKISWLVGRTRFFDFSLLWRSFSTRKRPSQGSPDWLTLMHARLHGVFCGHRVCRNNHETNGGSQVCSSVTVTTPVFLFFRTRRTLSRDPGASKYSSSPLNAEKLRMFTARLALSSKNVRGPDLPRKLLW